MKDPIASHVDVLILGSGLAGQSLALRLADTRKVALVTKKSLDDSASSWAQGGIAAVLDPADSTDAHIEDTLTAGAGLCNPAATRFVVESGREAIDWLINRGVAFTRDESALGYHLTREGGHGKRRVIHAADATGAEVQKTLTAQVLVHPNIQIFEQHIAVDLISATKLGLPEARCLGAYVLDTATKPYRIKMKSEMVKSDKPKEEMETTGIIELTDVGIRICYHLPGGKEPTEFKTQNNQQCFVLKKTN